ncbi:MAG: hypothetical protein MUO59_06810 [Actinobacteria bacterium]|nr:hypothetical protein [Actinomycetota bacterium]
MGIKKSLNFGAILIIILLVSIPLISCGPAASSSDKNGSLQDVGELSQKELEDLEKTLDEEVIEVVDYENAQIGADISGYMPMYLCTDADNYIKVTVTNTSDFTWRASGTNKVRLGYHYYGQDVDFGEYDKNTRTVLPDNLEPGESATVDVLINDITNPGTYVVQIDLALEGYFWFSSKGITMVEGNVFFESCRSDGGTS